MPEIELIVFSGDGEEIARHTFGPGAYTIGRATACDVTIKVGPISRQHARIVVGENGGVQVEDLASANGSLLDGQPIGGPMPWRNGQILSIGEVTIHLHGAAEFEAAPSPTQETVPPANDADDLLRRNLPLETREAQIYAVGEEVARGGMGAVLQARESATRRTVAMKVMLRGGDARSTLRFIEEAQVTAQLEHPNVVPVHDLGIDAQGQPFYTMKMVAGITLKKVIELLKAGVPATVEKYPLGTLLTDFQKVCDALAFAHSRGVIHRDLKPANIMLGKFGEVLVMDWGLAKIVGTKGALHLEATAGVSEVTVIGARREQSEVFSTMDGAIMGIPHYMSPEQAAGEIETLDTRSDIFALGIILYEILTLERPFTGRNATEIIAKIGEGNFIPPATRVAALPKSQHPKHLPAGTVPASLDAILRQALAPEKAARYPSVTALQGDLTAYQNGFATGAERAGAWKQLKLLIKRNQAASLGAAAVLLVGSVFGTGAIVQGRRATTALADLKKTAPSLLALAESAAELQRFPVALEKIEAGIAVDPDFRPAYWHRAWILLGLERWSDSAAALGIAASHDPANTASLSILPIVRRIAASHGDDERWNSEDMQEIYRHLDSVGETGVMIQMSAKLKLSGEQRLQLVKKRLFEAVPRGIDKVTMEADGAISVDCHSKPLRSLDAFRGLPIQSLNLRGTLIETLAPLRGLRLRTLSVSETPIRDLSPLKGMPLRSLEFGGTQVADLAPLLGMQLESVLMWSMQISDLRPLRGMPLTRFQADGCGGIRDFLPLKGAPIRQMDISRGNVSDLSFIEGMPLRDFTAYGTSIADLTPLQKTPLRVLRIDSTKVQSLSALNGLPIEKLEIRKCRLLRDISPVLTMPNLKYLACDQPPPELRELRQHSSLEKICADAYAGENSTDYRPVAEFWAAYDAQQKAGAK